MKVLIATPSVQGTVTSGHPRTLIWISQVLNAMGASYDLMTVDNIDVVTARTVLANAFLGDAGATHLLFLDSDMSVRPGVLRRLVELRAPMAGVGYPERGLDLKALGRVMAETRDIERAKAAASRFTVGVASGRVEVREGVVEVERLGFGCVLIEKALLLRLVEHGLAPPMESSQLRRAGLTGTIHDFFGELGGAGGERMSEDYAFCSRVRRLGDTPILAYIGPGVGHIGQFTYDAAFIEWLKSRARPPSS